MNKQLAILLASSLLATNAVTLAPVKAEAGANFYCGQSYDVTSKTNVPTTLVNIPGREEPIALIRWKSEYFAKWTPQERCAIISPKFQTAYTTGQLNYLAVGKSRKTGQGMLCALATAEESCENDANMLFTLKPYSDSKLVLSQLTGIVMGESNNPLYQSSGGKQVVDMRVLLKAKK
jgi:Circadian oscillating protein COP23